MTHEPECWGDGCRCGNAGFPSCTCPDCICTELRAAYRRGYNAHASSQQHWQDTHGAYRAAPEGSGGMSSDVQMDEVWGP